MECDTTDTAYFLDGGRGKRNSGMMHIKTVCFRGTIAEGKNGTERSDRNSRHITNIQILLSS